MNIVEGIESRTSLALFRRFTKAPREWDPAAGESDRHGYEKVLKTKCS